MACIPLHTKPNTHKKRRVGGRRVFFQAFETRARVPVCVCASAHSACVSASCAKSSLLIACDVCVHVSGPACPKRVGSSRARTTSLWAFVPTGTVGNRPMAIVHCVLGGVRVHVCAFVPCLTRVLRVLGACGVWAAAFARSPFAFVACAPLWRGACAGRAGRSDRAASASCGAERRMASRSGVSVCFGGSGLRALGLLEFRPADSVRHDRVRVGPPLAGRRGPGRGLGHLWTQDSCEIRVGPKNSARMEKTAKACWQHGFEALVHAVPCRFRQGVCSIFCFSLKRTNVDRTPASLLTPMSVTSGGRDMQRQRRLYRKY